MPTCSADGVACQSAAQCCSGECNGGFCGGGPIACGVSSNANQCDVCLAESCCPQVNACDSNATCLQSQQCFDGCYAGPGTGASCAQKCGASFPSSQGAALTQCAASSCAASCN
ncbi:MAG: hypothetical protein ACRELB_03925 [Polyangiaceae bacterium]